MDPTTALLAEQLEVGKRTVETARVRIGTRVVEREETVEMPLRHDELEVERVSVDRVVERPSEIRIEGDVTIVPVHEEVLVVTKQLVLKEELRITRRSTVHAGEPQRHRLRSEEPEVIRDAVGKPV
jgi:uncharacterized protein (TIGR02271 family)